MRQCPAVSRIRRCVPRWPQLGALTAWTLPNRGMPKCCGRTSGRAALAAAGRAHRLDPAEQRHAEVLWEDFWAATRAVELTETITAHAGHLASRHALRGADAVHLASLLAVGAAETLFAVWDQKLRTGAEATGVQLAPMA